MARTAARGNSASVTLVSCRQIRSGSASAAKRARWSRRWRSELTFQVASRRTMAPILAGKRGLVETPRRPRSGRDGRKAVHAVQAPDAIDRVSPSHVRPLSRVVRQLRGASPGNLPRGLGREAGEDACLVFDELPGGFSASVYGEILELA